jgi:fumarate hydratase class I
MIPNCAATRHTHFTLTGEGAVLQTPPDLSLWPDIHYKADKSARRVNLDTLDKAAIQDWKTGEVLLLSGKMLTGRDAAHKRLLALLDEGKELPVDLHNRFIYYVGPVDPIEGEAVGPAGPTTATRMDKFTDTLLSDTGLLGTIGKAERGALTVKSIKQHQSVYLMAVGGAAYLVSKAIVSAEVKAFPELGMEAIYEFEVKDMPVTVAVDSQGQSIHQTGPAQWQRIIFEQKD